MTAKKSIGTTLTKGVVVIGSLTNISPPEKSADTKEVTTLDVTDGYKRFIAGLKDGGEVTVKGYFDSSDAGQIALDTGFEAGTEDTFVIAFPATIGATFTFAAVITKFKVGEVDLENPLEFEATLKVSGKPDLAVVASAGISAATFVKTDGATELTALAVTPVFTIGTFIYGITFTTENGFKPKITAAAHTIKLFVDGAYSENLTSGSAGSLIAIGAAATKKLDVVVFEAGKSPKTYTFMVSRLS